MAARHESGLIGRRHSGVVLPSLAQEDQPSRVLSEAFAAGSALYSVTGVPGVGKSVWADQLLSEAGLPGPVRWRVVSVRCDGAGRDLPFALVEQIIKAAGTTRATARTVDEQASTQPSLLRMSQRVITALLRGVSASRRLLVVVDDAHHADEESVRVLRVALNRLAATGVCAVFVGQDPRTASMGESVVASDRTAWRAVRRIVLEPLNTPGARAYLSAVHGLEVSNALAERIRRAATGLPLLVDQVVRDTGPVWAARAQTPPGQRARFDEDVTDAVIAQGFQATSPFAGLSGDLPGAARVSVEIVAAAAVPLRAEEIAQIAHMLHVSADVPAALASGLLTGRGEGSESGLSVFHDLYAADVAAHADDRRLAAILDAAAGVVPGRDEAGRHRALVWRLHAALLRKKPLAGALLDQVRASVIESAKARRVNHVFEAMETAIELAGRNNAARSDELVVGLYALAAHLSALPRMIEWIPRLEQATPGLLRDLALLHVREFRGDYDWAQGFAEELLTRLPEFPENPADVSDATTLLRRNNLAALIVRMHTLLILGLMAPQARPGDYGLDWLAQARAGASWLVTVQQDDPAAWANASARLDRRFDWLPSAHDVLLRAIGMSVFGVSATGAMDKVQAEIAALSQAIAAAPEHTPTLFDARLIRAGVFSAVGFIGMAAGDLTACMAMLRSGIAGWGTGTARTMHLYCQYLLGNTEEVTATADEAAATILDDMDVVARPVFYALRAVIAANSGDEDGYQASMDALAHTTVTDYDTIGVEYELLARISYARLHHDPEAQLAVFDPDGPMSGRLLRSQNLFAYKVDALASLGRAEDADRELARLRALPTPGFQPVYGSLDWLEGRVHEAYGLTTQAIRSYRAAADPDGPGERLPAVISQAALDVGRLMIATGASKQAARRYLRAAQRTFTRLGHTPAAHEATVLIDATHDAGLLSAGTSDGPQIVASDELIETLTPREREVATLAGTGLANAEIAGALRITVKAVAFHMGNVLKKLGLASRRQLHTRGSAPPPAGDADPRFAGLSPRQRIIAILVAQGLTDAEIADELGLSIRTVGGHVHNILTTLGVTSRRELHRPMLPSAPAHTPATQPNE